MDGALEVSCVRSDTHAAMLSPEQMAAHNTRAAMAIEEGRITDARDILHHGLRAARDQMGEDSEVTMSMMHNYGSLLCEMKKYDEAQALLLDFCDSEELWGVTFSNQFKPFL